MTLSEMAVSPASLGLFAAAGGLGAVLRYLLDAVVRTLQLRRVSRQAPAPSRLPGPLGIFIVNALACLGIGALSAAVFAVAEPYSTALAAGLLGGFSTFSTVAVDSAQLLRARRWGWLIHNTLGMLLLSTAVCFGALLLLG